MRLSVLISALWLLSLPCWAIPSPDYIPPQVVNSSSPDAKIQVLNEKEPGAEVDIKRHLVKNQINIVVFFADW